MLKNLAKADPRVRTLDPTLGLGATCIYIMNACFTRPAEGFGWEVLIENCCQQVLEDLEADDEDAPTVPDLYDSGTYFICDIVMNTGRTTFLRLPLQRTFDPESMARIYHKASINDVKASFDWSNVVPSKQLSNTARTHNRNRNTRNIDDVRDPERQALDMEIRGVVVKPAVRLAGRDLDLHVLNGGDERDLDDAGGDPQVELSAGQRVAKISPSLSTNALIWHSQSYYKSLSCHSTKLSTACARQISGRCTLTAFSPAPSGKLEPVVRIFPVALTTGVTYLSLVL